VLHVLSQEKLSKALFPVGDYPKPEIRQIAEKYGLPTASRKDSQDLCFLAGEDYRSFLQRNAAEMLRRGEIVTQKGVAIGQHDGLANYTIGQRKGLGIASPVPLYVLGKNPSTNTLVVGTQRELGSGELTARDVNWVSGQTPGEPFRAEVKIRYTAREAEALVTPLSEGRAAVKFDAPQRDITAGQAAVFYHGDLLIGGGIIL
jgi:tRNA-specific 2-thiouridylase